MLIFIPSSITLIGESRSAIENMFDNSAGHAFCSLQHGPDRVRTLQNLTAVPATTVVPSPPKRTAKSKRTPLAVTSDAPALARVRPRSPSGGVGGSTAVICCSAVRVSGMGAGLGTGDGGGKGAAVGLAPKLSSWLEARGA